MCNLTIIIYKSKLHYSYSHFDRSLTDYPIKKRRVYDRTFTRNAYERVNNNVASFSHGKGYGGSASRSIATMHEG